MNECFGNTFIRNGSLYHCSLFDNSLVFEGDSVYEVLRVMDGNPVFFSDHINRLENSVISQGKKMLASAETLQHNIIKLIAAEKFKEVNVKLVFNYKAGIDNYLIYYTTPLYPTEKQYSEGVKGITFNAVRKDPVSKVINHRLRSDIYQKLISTGAYEALLVDHQNRITEGSRSNVFFIRHDTIYTAPDSMILSGITRKYILEICKEISVPVFFECVNAGEIDHYEAVFMSGTSPVVLPFSFIDATSYDPGIRLMKELRTRFQQKAALSIEYFRTLF